MPVAHAAVVWLDHWHALVARRDERHQAILEVAREAAPEQEYLLRVARATEDCARVMILGPGDDRLAFEREYVSLYKRPDRLVDVEASPGTSAAELMDRLRLLEGDVLARPVG